MGIKGLGQFLKKRKINPTLISLRDLEGRKIAVDAFLFMWAHINVAHNHNVKATDVGMDSVNRQETLIRWYNSALQSILLWLGYGITPIFVFDGKHPLEKVNTQNSRKEKTRQTQEDLDKYTEEVFAMDILERDASVVAKLRKLLMAGTYPTTEERKTFKTFLESLGLPCLQASGEGEKLCTSLVIDGYVDGVFSTDTDCLAYGCSYLFNDTVWNNEIKCHCFQTLELEKILSGLELTQEQFRELCILFGCDYSCNVKGIGPEKAYTLITSVGEISDLLTLNPSSVEKKLQKVLTSFQDGYQVLQDEHKTCGFDRCLELFAYQSSDEQIESSNVPSLKIFLPSDLLSIMQVYQVDDCYQEYKEKASRQ
jgi:flap endonuclease-1